jgi:hypothetical protein
MKDLTKIVKSHGDAFQVLGAIAETTGLGNTIASGKFPLLDKQKAREINNTSTYENLINWLLSVGVTEEQLEKIYVSYGQISYNG